MKKFLLILSLATGFAACKSKDSESPKLALDGMFNAMKSGDLDAIKKFITKSDVAMLEAGEQLISSVDPTAVRKLKTRISDEFREKVKYVTYTLKNEKIDGDQATVEAEITENPHDGQGTGKTSSHTFELVKEDGAWKIAITKPGNEMFNSMKGNMGPRNKGLEGGLEKLQNMPPDSLKILLEKGMQALDSLDKSQKKD